MAPGSLVYANQSTGSSRITARAVARRGCLRWLDVDRMKGGAGARLDRGEVKARPSGARKSGPRGETSQVERREVRVPVIRHAAPQGAKDYQAPFGALLPSLWDQRKEGVAGASKNTAA